jgi:hypothetical protein
MYHYRKKKYTPYYPLAVKKKISGLAPNGMIGSAAIFSPVLAP